MFNANKKLKGLMQIKWSKKWFNANQNLKGLTQIELKRFN